MKCKIFIGTPPVLEHKVNEWLKLNRTVIQLSSQSYAENKGELVLTLFYTDQI